MTKIKHKVLIVAVAVLTCTVVALAAIAIPAFVRARRTSQASYCSSGMICLIESAKEQWAMTNQATNAQPVTWSDLRPYLGARECVCQSGGTYTLGAIGQDASCSISEHRRLWEQRKKMIEERRSNKTGGR